MSKYTPELKDKVLRLYFEDGRTILKCSQKQMLWLKSKNLKRSLPKLRRRMNF